jgi:hypothetical protein
MVRTRIGACALGAPAATPHSVAARSVAATPVVLTDGTVRESPLLECCASISDREPPAQLGLECRNTLQIPLSRGAEGRPDDHGESASLRSTRKDAAMLKSRTWAVRIALLAAIVLAAGAGNKWGG